LNNLQDNIYVLVISCHDTEHAWYNGDGICKINSVAFYFLLIIPHLGNKIK